MTESFAPSHRRTAVVRAGSDSIHLEVGHLVVPADVVRLAERALLEEQGDGLHVAGPVQRCVAVAIGDTEVISRGPQLNLFRATTDNDGIRAWDHQDTKPMGQWLAGRPSPGGRSRRP